MVTSLLYLKLYSIHSCAYSQVNDKAIASQHVTFQRLRTAPNFSILQAYF
jgi:hypothetical protein